MSGKSFRHVGQRSRFASIVFASLLSIPALAQAAEGGVAFDGEKSTWHDGFDRFDFVMDEESLAIKPL